MSPFKDILRYAKSSKSHSIAERIEVYRPLLVSNYIVRDKFNDVLLQELLNNSLTVSGDFPCK